ncbi:MAG: hypothetical protein NTW99_02365, partial [Chloroflexi bacterium]|nr:hypothetical protein [Chloroflexota bacterium]
QDGVEYALAQTTTGLQLVVLADPAAPRAPSPVSRPRTGTTTREPGLPRENRDYHAGTGTTTRKS